VQDGAPHAISPLIPSMTNNQTHLLKDVVPQLRSGHRHCPRTYGSWFRTFGRTSNWIIVKGPASLTGATTGYTVTSWTWSGKTRWPHLVDWPRKKNTYIETSSNYRLLVWWLWASNVVEEYNLRDRVKFTGVLKVSCLQVSSRSPKF
jgi:hypothetical protein